jgi:transposase
MARGKAAAQAIAMTPLQILLFCKAGSKRTIQQQFSTRIDLLLRAQQGQSTNQIARDLGLAVNTVRLWRSRWQGCYEQLCAYEREMKSQSLSKHDYLQVLLGKLKDEPRSGTRKQISLAAEQQIVALASEKPQDYGVEMTGWTHQMLAKVAIAQGVVAKISSRHVGNILKKANCNPTSQRTGFSPG